MLARAVVLAVVALAGCRSGSHAPEPPVSTPPPRDATPPCEPERSIAQSLLAEGRVERALRATDRFAERCPGAAPRIWATRVTALAALGRVDEALALASTIEASRDAPEEARAAAREARKTAARIDHGSVDDGDTTLEDEGLDLLARGDPKRALERFEAACERNAHCDRARVGAALSIRALGDPGRARRELDRALYLREAAGAERARVVPRAHFSRALTIPTRKGSRWLSLSDDRMAIFHATTLVELTEIDWPAPPRRKRPDEGDRTCVVRCRDGASSPDGRFVAWLADSEPLFLWDAASDAPPVVLANDVSMNPVEVAFSPDGRLLAASVDDGVALFDAKTRSRLRVVPGTPPFAFSPDAARITTSKGRFDVATGATLDTIRLAEGESVDQVAVDGEWVVTAGRAHRGGARLHAFGAPKKPVRRLPADFDHFRMVPSPDATKLLALGVTGPVRLWEIAPFAVEMTWDAGLEYEGASFAPTGAMAAVWGSPARIQLLDPYGRQGMRTLHAGDDEGARAWVDDVVFSSDGRALLAVGERPRSFRVFDVETGERRVREIVPSRREKERTAAIENVAVDERGRVTSGDDVLLDPARGVATRAILVRGGAPIATLVGIEGVRAGYVLAEDGRVELLGEEAGRAGDELACAIGHDRFPFALCADRALASHLIEALARGLVDAR